MLQAAKPAKKKWWQNRPDCLLAKVPKERQFPQPPFLPRTNLVTMTQFLEPIVRDFDARGFPKPRLQIYSHGFDISEFLATDSEILAFGGDPDGEFGGSDGRNTKAPVTIDTAIRRLRTNWSDCNVLLQLAYYNYKFDKINQYNVNNGLRGVYGFRLDFDTSAGFKACLDVYNYLKTYGLYANWIVQTSASDEDGVCRFHCFIKVERYLYADLGPMFLIRSKIPKADHTAVVDRIRLPGTVTKGKFVCTGEVFSEKATDFQSIIDEFYLAGLVTEEEVIAHGARVTVEQQWHSKKNSSESDSEEYHTANSSEQQAKQPSESDPAGSQEWVPKEGTKAYKPLFKKQILQVIQELKVEQFRYKIRYEAQASYLSSHLGYLNNGHHGMALTELAKWFGVSDKTAGRLREAWEEAGLIVKTAKWQWVTQNGRQCRKSDEFKAGPALANLVPQRIASVDAALAYLNDLYPLDDGLTYRNAKHWVWRLRDQGLDLDAIADLMAQHATSHTRNWRQEARRLLARYKTASERKATDQRSAAG